MRLIASDFITHHRPTPCELRVWLRHRDEPERDATVFEGVLHRLGERHEREHLSTLGECANLSGLTEDQRIKKTLEAIAVRASVIYQPVFRARHMFGAAEVEILGIPDFLILDGDGYIIRDAKMARRIDKENHPEILLQVQLYGWLFEKSRGVPPKALQVFSGMKETVTVPYDGGVAALAALERLLAVKKSDDEAYEPVGWSKCNPCVYNERCWNRAEAKGDVALVMGLDQSIARKLNSIGIGSRKELLSEFNAVSLADLRCTVGNKEQRIGRRAERILQFADAMEKQAETVLALPVIPQLQNYVMFDLEGMPPHLDELDKIYLWGMQVCGDKPSEFTAAVSGFGPNGDEEGWLAFLENAKKVFGLYGDIPFVHWASYEKTYLLRYINRYGDVGGTAARAIANLLDLLPIMKESIILPVASFSLKVIEQYVGYKRKQAEYGGQWAMAMFIEATETSDEGKRKELMDEILAYNKEDLEATWVVFQWLKNKVLASNPRHGSVS
jgi:predicted RecB family nuclease